MSTIIESQVFAGEMYIKASDHHRAVEHYRFEVEVYRRRHDALLEMLAKNASMHANPPVTLMAEPESFNAGKAMAFNEAKYTIGIDTSDGVHTVVVYRMLSGEPTTLVASARLPEGGVVAEREAIIDLVAAYGGSVDLEAAIRARGKR